MDQPVVRDAALLILRLVLGVVFVAKGFQRIFVDGIDATAGYFSVWGVPQPKLSAVLCSGTELLGGALLVVGLLTTFIAGVLALLVVAAIYFVHLTDGFAAMEYPLVMTVALLMIIVFGAGRASVDGILHRAAL